MFTPTFPLKEKLIAFAVGALALAAIVIGILMWGQSRYDAGVVATDAKWVAAGQKLQDQARASGRAADVKEADRIEDHAARMAAEKERIDDAVAVGGSPLDALFGG